MIIFFIEIVIIKRNNKHGVIVIIEFISGLMFAFATSISNMTKLSATISFLDLTNFNPALIFVMIGAIGIASVLFFFIKKNNTLPLLENQWYLPTSSDIDLNLVTGAAMFGIG
jgi:uncharacterized membrane protein YedE/YeeE